MVLLDEFCFVFLTRMRIQFCSDLHLEMNKPVEYTELLTPVAPVLALLGDIGDPESDELRKFIEWCTRMWKQVLYIPGNHEFWRLKPGSKKTISSALTILRSFEKLFPNFLLMWRGKVYSEDGIIVLGTPLWSRPAEGVIPHEHERAWVDNDRTFDAQTLATLHQEDLNWLKQELTAARGTMVVILTHYAPSLLLINRNWINRPEATLYASDLDILIRPPVVAWACGHVHQSIQWLKGWESATGETGVVLLTTNPRGYVRDESGFRTDAVLRINPSAAHQVEGESLFETPYKILESTFQS